MRRHWFSFALAIFALLFRTDLLRFCFVFFFFLSASVGHSAFRLLAYELEWNVEAAVQFWPAKTPRKIFTPRPVVHTFESESTRVAVVFCPAWTVSDFLRNIKIMTIKKKVDLKTWAWIFSDFGNQEVSWNPYCLSVMRHPWTFKPNSCINNHAWEIIHSDSL